MDLTFLRKGRMFYARLITFVLAMGLLLSAGNSFGQSGSLLSRKITYKASQMAISKVLKQVREREKVRFTYNSELLRRQQLVSIDVTGVTLRDFLEQLLLNSGLQFSEEMGGIVIYEKTAPAAPVRAGETKLSVVLHGRVTDPQGNPVAGVSIRGLQSNEMTATSADGLFMLVANDKEMVNFSLMGMRSFTYKVQPTNEQLLVFKMDTVVREIQEVVVNGYQKIDPRLATGSYLKLNATDILQPGVPSVDRMLQGKVPGLMVLNTTGSVNGKATMRIRGTSTLIGNAAPLLVVDGMIRPDPVNMSNSLLNNLMSSPGLANYEMMGNAIAGVNPYDIENITFLKDAAATSIYGTRAANGVIVITTKRGKVGDMQVGYSANVSFQGRPNYNRMRLMNSKERVQLSREMEEDHTIFTSNQSGFVESFSYEGLRRQLYAREITEAEFNAKVGELETMNTDWFKELFRNQLSMQHSLNFSGGANKTTYYASASYAANNGAAKKDGNKMYSASLNVRSQLTKRLNIDLTLQSSLSEREGYFAGVNPLTYALQTSRILNPDVFYPIGRKNTLAIGSSDDQGDLGALQRQFYYNFNNEVAHTENTSSQKASSLNLQLEYKIAPGLYFRNQSSAIMNTTDGFSSADEQTYYATELRTWNYGDIPSDYEYSTSYLPTGGMAFMLKNSGRVLSMKNMLDYTRGFFKERDQLSVSLGQELSSESYESFDSQQPGYFPEKGRVFVATDASRRKFATNNLTNGINNIMSFYGTAGYSLMNRYVLSATVRTDGSNRFGQYSNARFLPNYSISGRWNAGLESWFPTGNVLSDLQLRLSYGTQGQIVDAVGPNLIATYLNSFTNALDKEPRLRIKSLPYPDLRWEKTYQWNGGATLSMFNNRFRVNVDGYHKRSVDVIDLVDIPFEYGMEQMYQNGSTVYNSGVELMVNVDAIRNRDMTFSFSLNTGYNKNSKGDQHTQNNYQSFFNGSGRITGKPVSGIYSYRFAGLDPQTGIPTFDGLDRNTKTSDPDAFLVYSGQLQPKTIVGFNPFFRYKSLVFTSSFILHMGSVKRLNPPFRRTSESNSIPSPLMNANYDFNNRWRKPGDEAFTNIPKLTDQLPYLEYLVIPYTAQSEAGNDLDIRVNQLTAYNLSDIRTVANNYMRCNNMSLSYAISPVLLKPAGIKSLNIGLSVNNVFQVASRNLQGQDPEIDGAGTIALPITRQFAISINTAF